MLAPGLSAMAEKENEKLATFQFEGSEKLRYKTTGEAMLHLHVFKPDDWQAEDSRAGIVFFFGGGWVGGNPGQFEPHCKYLASRGMVAITAEYRVKSRHNTGPFECVADGKSAVRWVRAHAKDLGINSNLIAAGGGSAGGHVASATGTTKGLDEPGDDLSISSRPNALILFNPVYNNGPGEWGHEKVKERYQEISPAHNIRPGMPPAIVFLGTEDSLIKVAVAEEFKSKMERVGSKSELHLYDGAAHGFFNHGRNGNKYYLDTVRKMDKFLNSLGYLNGKPTL